MKTTVSLGMMRLGHKNHIATAGHACRDDDLVVVVIHKARCVPDKRAKHLEIMVLMPSVAAPLYHTRQEESYPGLMIKPG